MRGKQTRANQNQAIEDKIILEVGDAKSIVDSLDASLKNIKDTIETLQKASGLEKVGDDAEKSEKKVVTLASTLKQIGKIGLMLTGTVAAVRKIGKSFGEFINYSNKYIESKNLFDVAMDNGSETYNKALYFQNQLAQNVGLNIQETMEYQSTMQSMIRTMGLANKESEFLSENLSRVALDLSSLYNRDVSDVMERVEAGLAGQSKPLRTLGIDISETALREEALRLGIDENVRSMSQANKTLLRYITIQRQAQIASGDLAKTIESPTNQIRIMQAQIENLKRSLGNFFQGILGNILPVVNGILMAINAILNAFAPLTGQTVNIAGFADDITEGFEDIETGVGGATGAVKEFKKQLMGFDEIHNIELPDNSGGGGGGGGTTNALGINPKLLSALKDYDKNLGNIKTKAEKIRDAIMKWLGFVKKINKQTGEVFFELEKGWKKFDAIVTTVKALLATIGTIKLASKISKLVTAFGGFAGAFTVIEGLLGIFAVFEGVFTSLAAGMKEWNGEINSFDAAKLGVIGTLLSSLGGALIGLMIAGPVGALIGGLGGAIAGMLGFVAGGVVAFKEFVDNTIKEAEASDDAAEAIRAQTQAWKDVRKAQEEELQLKINSIETNKSYVQELDSIVDENGKIKAGYEARAQFITGQLKEATGIEMQINDGVIEGYTNLRQAILDNLEEQKAAAIMEVKLERYKEAIRNKSTYVIKIREAREELEKQNKILDNQKKLIDEQYGSYDNLVEAMKNGDEAAKSLFNSYVTGSAKTNELTAEIQDLSTKLDDSYADIADYEESVVDYTNHNYEAIEARQVVNGKVMQMTLGEQLADRQRQYYESGSAISEEEQAQLDALARKLYDGLAAQTQTIKDFKAINVEDWRELAMDSESVYAEELAKLDPDTQNIINMMLNGVETLTPATVASWRNMATENETEYYNLLEQLPNDQATIITTLIDGTEASITDSADTWKEMASKNREQFDAIMSKLDPDTAAYIRRITGTVTQMTPEEQKTWETLAKNNIDEYRVKMETLPESTQKHIESVTGVMKGNEESVRKSAAAVYDKILDEWDKEPEAKKAALNDMQGMLNGLDDPTKRELLKKAGIKDADIVMEQLNKGALTEEYGKQILNGLRLGIANGSLQDELFAKASSIASRVTNTFKNIFKIGSPSKLFKQYGKWNLEGLEIGFEDMENPLLKTVKGIASSVTNIFDKNLGIDTTLNNIDTDIAKKTKFKVDYGSVSSEVRTAANLQVSGNLAENIANACYQAVVNGMQNSSVNVEIEAKTEEGTLVKKVANGFTKSVRATGELPFELPL